MRSKDHSKLSNEFQRMIIDFWIEKDVRPEWIMRILIETAAGFTPKVDEYFENRTDYDKAEAFDQIIKISEECDNYMDFGDEIDAVVRSYKEDL